MPDSLCLLSVCILFLIDRRSGRWQAGLRSLFNTFDCTPAVITNSWSRIILEKLVIARLVNNFSHYHIYRSHGLDPILSLLNPVYILELSY
jgi:hypothetical protein